jgi:hypothetical protein
MFSLRLFCPILFLCGLAAVPTLAPQNVKAPSPATYLGFDCDEYPGDDALPSLRKTFYFTSYWLSPPPGEKRSTWFGKRALLQSQGFGFAVLFNGRESRTLRNSADARQKATLDAQSAVKFAEEEGFAKGTVIFLDIEEGGRLPAPYYEYLQAWSNTLAKAGYRAGVYCSAIPVDEGQGVHITTAQDIQAHVTSPGLDYWVYNDACPPAFGSMRSLRAARNSPCVVPPAMRPMAIAMRPATRSIAGSSTPTSPPRRTPPPAIKICN